MAKAALAWSPLRAPVTALPAIARVPRTSSAASAARKSSSTSFFFLHSPLEDLRGDPNYRSPPPPPPGSNVQNVVNFANSQWNCVTPSCSQTVPAGSAQVRFASNNSRCTHFLSLTMPALSLWPARWLTAVSFRSPPWRPRSVPWDPFGRSNFASLRISTSMATISRGWARSTTI